MSNVTTIQDEAVAALSRVREFDPATLVRKEELGQTFAFELAVAPAKRLQSIFKKMPLDAVSEFPDQEVGQIKSQADNVYRLFTQVLEFDPEEADAKSRRDSLVENLKNQYQPVFSALFPFISYAVARTVDFDQLSADGRAAVQAVRDEASVVMRELGDTSSKAEMVLQQVREAAAEQGVTHQAVYFGDQADRHGISGTKWLVATIILAAIVIASAVFSFFLPKIEYFNPSNVAESIQLIASKVLYFVVLGFALIQCAKNYAAHRHNEVANRHRQNALLTYTTLTEAGGTVEARDTILQHAAAAIYTPSDSGYIKQEERGFSASPPLAIAPKMPPIAGASGEG